VRVLVPFAPWRLMISLTGLNLSGSGILALHAAGGDAQALELLAVGDAYELQLEQDDGAFGHGTAHGLPARLVRRVRTTVGHELAFAFDGVDSGLLGLVHELGPTGARL
jgi:hypothetical protein